MAKLGILKVENIKVKNKMGILQTMGLILNERGGRMSKDKNETISNFRQKRDAWIKSLKVDTSKNEANRSDKISKDEGDGEDRQREIGDEIEKDQDNEGEGNDKDDGKGEDEAMSI